MWNEKVADGAADDRSGHAGDGCRRFVCNLWACANSTHLNAIGTGGGGRRAVAVKVVESVTEAEG